MGILLIETEITSPHYIIELLEGNEVIRTAIDVKKISFEKLTPGQYKIRCVIDRNGNKQWDNGNFFKKEEPESILYYTNEKGVQDIPIKANWEVGPLLITDQQVVNKSTSTNK